MRRNVFDASFGTALSDIVPYAFMQLLPILGALIVLGVGGMSLAKGGARVTAGMIFGLLGVLLVLAGMLANAVFYIGDAQLGGTVFEEGTRVLISYGAILAVLGGIVHWGPKLWGRTMPDKAVIPLALFGFLGTALAGLPYLIAGFAKQPADVVTYAYAGPARAVERPRRRRTRPDGRGRRRLRRPWRSPRSPLTPTTGAPVTTRGTARRWSGPRRRPRPRPTSPRCR